MKESCTLPLGTMAAARRSKNRLSISTPPANTKSITSPTANGSLNQANQDFEAAVDLRTLDNEADIHRRMRVEQALSHIHGKQRDLLILFSQSYPWDHIGTLLGMTPESARTLCYRLIRRIRQAMGVKFKAKGNPSEEIE